MSERYKLEESRPPESGSNHKKYFFFVDGFEFELEQSFGDDSQTARSYVRVASVKTGSYFRGAPEWFPTRYPTFHEIVDPLTVAQLLDVCKEAYDRGKRTGAGETRREIKEALGI